MDERLNSPSALGFVPAQRKTSHPPTGRGPTQRQVTFEDFSVDGKRLYELLFIDHEPDFVTLFDSSWPQGALSAIDELLGISSSEFADKRVPLYVCPECADLGCGALSADIEFHDDEIIWSNFGWQNPFEDGWETGDDKHLTEFGTISFERGQYERVLQEMRDRYAAMPQPEPHQAFTARIRKWFRR